MLAGLRGSKSRLLSATAPFLAVLSECLVPAPSPALLPGTGVSSLIARFKESPALGDRRPLGTQLPITFIFRIILSVKSYFEPHSRAALCEKKKHTCLGSLSNQAETSRRAVEVSVEAWGAILGGAASDADLGGSSKYSNENFED